MFPPAKQGFVVCDICLEQNAPEDEECHICGTTLEDIDRDDVFDIYGHAPDDDPLGIFASGETYSDIATLTQIDHLHCIQCDAPEDECECGKLYVAFDEALLHVINSGVDIYDPASLCDNCIFAFSPRCEPLRGWLRTWIEDREAVENEQLTGCENYRSY